MVTVISSPAIMNVFTPDQFELSSCFFSFLLVKDFKHNHTTPAQGCRKHLKLEGGTALRVHFFLWKKGVFFEN